MSDETFGFGAGAAVADTDLPPELEQGEYEFIEREAGDFLPRILPGTVTFRYEEQEFQAAEGGKSAQIVFRAHVQTADLPPGRILRGGDRPELAVGYNRVTARVPAPFTDQNGRIVKIPSGFQELYSCLGLVETAGKPTSEVQLETTLRSENGQFGRGKLAWEATVKLDDGTIETFTTARKKERRLEAKGQYAARITKPWPVNADGSLPVRVTFSNRLADGTIETVTKVAQERIVALYPPRKAKD